MRITWDLCWPQPRLKPESLGLEPWASGCDKKPLSGIPGGLRAAPRTVRAQSSPSGVLLKCHPAAVGLGCSRESAFLTRCLVTQLGLAWWSKCQDQGAELCVCVGVHVCACACPSSSIWPFTLLSFRPFLSFFFFFRFWGDGVEGTTELNATNTTQTSIWTRSVRDSKLLPAHS